LYAANVTVPSVGGQSALNKLHQLPHKQQKKNLWQSRQQLWIETFNEGANPLIIFSYIHFRRHP
jgi:inosine-uridine nucleoside N-ribohydrolase